MYHDSRSLFGQTNKIFLRFRITIDHKRGFTNQHSVRQVHYVWDLCIKFFQLTGNMFCFGYLVSFGNFLSYRICQLFHRVLLYFLSMIQICSYLLVRMMNTLKHLSLVPFSVFRKLHYNKFKKWIYKEQVLLNWLLWLLDETHIDEVLN